MKLTEDNTLVTNSNPATIEKKSEYDQNDFLKTDLIYKCFWFFPGSTRGGAGTPQFQNLSGTIRTSANGLIPSSTATTPLTNNQNNSNQNNSEQIRTNQNNSAASRSTLTSLYHSSGSNSTPSIG